jgi:hypothetical protein
MTTKHKILIALGVVGVIALIWYLKTRGALARTEVTPAAIGVRSAIGSSFFSVHDRSTGNIMANLFAPATTPVSAGPQPVTNPANRNLFGGSTYPGVGLRLVS